LQLTSLGDARGYGHSFTLSNLISGGPESSGAKKDAALMKNYTKVQEDSMTVVAWSQARSKWQDNLFYFPYPPAPDYNYSYIYPSTRERKYTTQNKQLIKGEKQKVERARKVK